TVRGFDTGDNACTCPDFKSNTLGTCKHIEAVLERLQADGEPVKRRKAAITRPEVTLDYGAAQLRLRLQLPPRHSDPLDQLPKRFFDDAGFWTGKHEYAELAAAIESVPEQVPGMSDAMDFIDREVERRDLARREQELLAELDREPDTASARHLLKIPLYDFQARGAVFLACRVRSILADDMRLGKTIDATAGVKLLSRERAASR